MTVSSAFQSSHSDPSARPHSETIPGEELLFLPLGGSGEIGMNLNLYGCKGRWLMVDCGIGFGDDMTPGVDIMMPDPGFITRQTDRLAGLVLTHAHEDHFGAIPYFWDALGCPVFATPFAAAVLRRKLKAAKTPPKVDIREISCGAQFQIGPFDLRYIPLPHSIPEAQALMIRTDYGSALHSGDWKLDPTPLIGSAADIQSLQQCGKEGVDALVCDSTNVWVADSRGSEKDVRETLISLMARYPDVLIAATCFASNIVRLKSLALAAARNGRTPILVGRSLHRFSQAARECGYLEDMPSFADEGDVNLIPRDQALLICTGCQGEPRAALSRMAAGSHPSVKLSPGDVVIFSSRVINGNEKAITRTYNRLSGAGVEIVTDQDHLIHVSGHPGRSDLAKLYEWIDPEVMVPVHGEARHLQEQARFAKECGLPETLIPENGAVIRLAPGKAVVKERVHWGRLARHGERLIPLDGSILQQRQKILEQGTVFLVVPLDSRGNLLADPVLNAPGFLDPVHDKETIHGVILAMREVMDGRLPPDGCDDEAVIRALRKAVRRVLYAAVGLRPMIEIRLMRVLAHQDAQ